MNIGFVGAGRMASALGAGIAKEAANSLSVAAGESTPRFLVSDPVDAVCQKFEALVAPCDFLRSASNADVLASSDIVFVAVKPQMIQEALSAIDSTNKPLVISVVAGTTTDTLSTLLDTTRIIRVMPNTPCLIGQGAMAISAHSDVAPEDVSTARALISAVGEVVEVSESQLDAVTGLSGSGPAYVYLFMKALSEEGVRQGLPESVSKKLAVKTVAGAAAMVEATKLSFQELVNQVTSPGGTTLAGISALEQTKFSDSVGSAVKAATDRSVELGKSN